MRPLVGLVGKGADAGTSPGSTLLAEGTEAAIRTEPLGGLACSGAGGGGVTGGAMGGGIAGEDGVSAREGDSAGLSSNSDPLYAGDGASSYDDGE